MAIEKDIIKRNLEDFNQSIRDDIISKRINDTGAAAQSLKVIERGDKIQSVGNDYIEVLDRGRAPGSFAPVQNIRDWVSSKLGITEDRELRQVAFLVNRKIAREGTEIFNDKSKGLQIDEKILQLRSKLRDELLGLATANVKKELNKFKSQTL